MNNETPTIKHKFIHSFGVYILLSTISFTWPITVNATPINSATVLSSSDILSELDRSLSLRDEPTRTVHYHYEKQMDPHMQLHKFNSTSYNGNTVTCNDGSATGYYKRLNNHSKSWIIYLQGGGFCGSEEACQQRWRQSPHLMSSNFWQKSKSVDGILSSEPKDNPFLWNANHIYVPYCSSDSWSGLHLGRGNGATSGVSLKSYNQHQDDFSNNHQHQMNQHRSLKHTQNHQHKQSFAFMGSQILERVVESLFEDIPRESSLYEAKFILLAGDSAGATGVMLNLDKLNKFVQLKFAALRQNNNNCGQDETMINCNPSKQTMPPVFRGLADSGWFLDNEPYDYLEQYSNGPSPFMSTDNLSASSIRSSSHNNNNNNQASQYQDETDNQAQQVQLDCDRHRCNPLQSIRQAMLYWNGQVPASCAQRHPFEPWRCYFGYRVYQTLRTPLFVVQWLYDEAQLIVDNIGRPDTISQWNYVNRLVSDMRASLENVTALFAPSCFSHSLITKQTWNQININGLKLPHVLNSWEEENLVNQPTIEALSMPTRKTTTASEQHSDNSVNNQSSSNNISIRSTTQTFESSSRPQNNNRASNRSRKRKRNNQQSKSNNQNQSSRLGRSTAIAVESDPTSMLLNSNAPDIFSMTTTSRHQQDSSEKFRLIDLCGWPQCNRDCPASDQEYNSRSLLPY